MTKKQEILDWILLTNKKVPLFEYTCETNKDVYRIINTMNKEDKKEFIKPEWIERSNNHR